MASLLAGNLFSRDGLDASSQVPVADAPAELADSSQDIPLLSAPARTLFSPTDSAVIDSMNGAWLMADTAAVDSVP